MKVLITILFSLLSFFSLRAQEGRVALETIQGGANSMDSYGGMLIGKSLPSSEVDGDPYLFENFKNGTLKLNGDRVIEDTEINVDLFNNVIIVKRENGDIYSLASQYVNNIIINESEFKFINNLDSKISLIETLYQNLENDLEIWRKHYIFKKDPTYIEGVDMGNRNYVLLKRSMLLGMSDGKVSELKSRKDLFNLIQNMPDLAQHLKKSKSSPKDESKLINDIKNYFGE